jgi:mRNA-degrading endonuclease RelE of RelBE toxin-antitoxin system
LKKLVFTDQAKADLAGLDRATRLRIAAALQRLVQNNAGNVKKLQGIDPPEYRLRTGDWRVRLSYPEPETVRVNRVLNRKDAYR